MKKISINEYKTNKKVENIVAKGEIANLEQFLLSPWCFQKLSAAKSSESICMGERVKTEVNENTIIAQWFHYASLFLKTHLLFIWEK